MSRDLMRPAPASGGLLMPAAAAAEYASQREQDRALVLAQRDANRVRRAAAPAPVAAPSDETTLLDSLGELAFQAGLTDDATSIPDSLRGAPMMAFGPLGGLAQIPYSPRGLSAGFLDAATFGHAGELGALAQHVVQGRNYDEALPDTEATVAQAYADAPGSALVGSLAGMIPLGAVGGGLGAAGTGGRVARAVRMVAPAAAVGLTAGALGGGLAADEGEGLQGAVEGAGEGLATAVPAAALGVLGAGIRGSSQAGGAVRQLLSPFLAGGATGAGYGWAGAHGASPDASLDDYLSHAGQGAALGAPLEAAGSMIGAGLRMVTRPGSAQMPPTEIGPPRPASGLADDLDEAALLWGDSPAPQVEAEAVAGFRTPRELAQTAREADTRSPLGRAVGSLFEAAPEYDRLFSVSATGPGTARQLRSGANAFGGPRAWVDELQALGLAEEGTVYSREAERAAVERTRNALGTQARGYHSAVENTGVTTPGSAIADAMEADAAQMRARSTAPEVQAAADALEARAASFRFAEAEMPGLDGAEAAMVPRTLSYREILNELAEQGRLNNEAYASPLVSSSLTPSQRSGVNVYRNLATARNAMAEQALGPEQYANMRQTMRGFQATNGVSPVNLRLDINAMHQPANLRGAMGGMGAQLGSAIEGGGVLDQGLARVGGSLKESLIANYQHSLRAAANERLIPGMMRQLNGMGIDPATASHLSGVLSGQAPGLAALGALRLRDNSAAAFDVADSAASAALDADDTEDRYDDVGTDYLRALTGVAAPDVDGGVPEPVDPEEEAYEARGSDFLRSLTGVPESEEDEVPTP